MSDSYKNAGVNIDQGNQFIDSIKPFIKQTNRRGVLTDIGGFGGLFALDINNYKEPVLVSSTDGVGTKVKLAIELEKLDTIGIDLVAMCVNDIICLGAEPLFFLDYFATGKLKPDLHKDIIKGIADACKQTKCALIGGETAEMPDMYQKNDFDLAGFAVGVVDRNKIIDGTEVRIGQSIIGMASSGFHSNGYALIRKIIKDKNLDLGKTFENTDQTLGELLLKPTKLYSTIMTHLIRELKITSIAHITGGGFIDNIPRVLPKSLCAKINKGSWDIPPVIKFIQDKGDIAEKDMYRIFNCGIGLIFVLPENQTREALELIRAFGEKAFILGSITQQKNKDTQIILS